MSTPLTPHMEVLHSAPIASARDSHPPRRWIHFATTFLLALLIGLAVVYLRQPIYRAAASVLTVKAKAADMQSVGADQEHVAIQQRFLLGEELLDNLARRQNADAKNPNLDANDLRAMLDVVAVPDTNLVELRAHGSDPAQLQRLVNSWGESYQQLRAREIESASALTTAELKDKQDQLAKKIETTRAELSTFRETHDIVSVERDENRSLSSLKGLNNALNKAQEELITTRAKKMAIEEAIAKGETVVPPEQKSDIAKLKLEVERTREKLVDVQSKFTQRFIERDPDLESLPETLASLERDLAQALAIAQETVRDETQQAFVTSIATVTALEQQLAQHQGEVQQFTDRFKEFKSLEEGLVRLDRLFAENAERISGIEVTNERKFPPIKIVERARLPSEPVSPNYQRDLLVAIAAALGLALFVTWLFEYLSDRSTRDSGAGRIDVRIYGTDQPLVVGAPQPTKTLVDDTHRTQLLTDSRTGPLPRTSHTLLLPRELASAEIESLFAVASPLTTGYGALLLCGVAPGELAELRNVRVDLTDGLVSISAPSVRVLQIPEEISAKFRDALSHLNREGLDADITALDLHLVNGAREAGVTEPVSVNALAIWHSYVCFLIRQGADLDTLNHRVGAISPEVYQSLAHLLPVEGIRRFQEIDFTHPAIAK